MVIVILFFQYIIAILVSSVCRLWRAVLSLPDATEHVLLDRWSVCHACQSRDCRGVKEHLLEGRPEGGRVLIIHRVTYLGHHRLPPNRHIRTLDLPDFLAVFLRSCPSITTFDLHGVILTGRPGWNSFFTDAQSQCCRVNVIDSQGSFCIFGGERKAVRLPVGPIAAVIEGGQDFMRPLDVCAWPYPPEQLVWFCESLQRLCARGRVDGWFGDWVDQREATYYGGHNAGG